MGVFDQKIDQKTDQQRLCNELHSMSLTDEERVQRYLSELIDQR